MSDDQNKKLVEEKKEKGKKKEKKEVKVSVDLDPKLSKILDQVADLSVLELSQLVKGLEEKFGVQAIAAAPVAANGGNGNGADAAPAEEKTQFTVVMTESGANKINVIKALREIKPELGLKDAKDMTEKLPAEVLVDAKKVDAEEAQKKLGEAGAKVELK